MVTSDRAWAIPTTYNGIVFRSRTEARWAVFFDGLGVPWIHEPEGYQLSSAWYVPDFWLPDQEVFWEVKGEMPTSEETKKAEELAAATGKEVLIAWGQPEESQGRCDYDVNEGAFWFFGELGGHDISYRWCVCPKCGKVGCEFDGRGARVCGDRCTKENKAYSYDHPRVLAAVETSRTHRFWDSKS